MADIGDSRRVNEIFAEAGPEIVIHAAALKHVDLLEGHTEEALRVNVLGLWTCIAAAETIGSKLFLFISSDKAVDPVSVLGITKRIGECMVASLADSPTVFAAVRFGNVIGSRGSVIPRFERQIARGGPLTVTDPDVRRYFMSITEAVSLVLQSATIARSGHVYVLDMGEEVAIINVARRLAQLRGLRVPEDIQIVFTGLRPGERMREHLVGEDESTYRTQHPKVLAVTGIPRWSRRDWAESLERLSIARNDETPGALRRELADLVEKSASQVGIPSAMPQA
jgi:FlaA1/EpsC-like NDP-sugar epimerase